MNEMLLFLPFKKWIDISYSVPLIGIKGTVNKYLFLKFLKCSFERQETLPEYSDRILGLYSYLLYDIRANK